MCCGSAEADWTRDLRAAVFSNLDGLFAFHTSAEDAEYPAEELGGGLDTQDLLELGHYQCYGRLTDVRTGERLPAFSVRLDPRLRATPFWPSGWHPNQPNGTADQRCTSNSTSRLPRTASGAVSRRRKARTTVDRRLALAVGYRPEESQPAGKCRGQVGAGIARNEPMLADGGREAIPVETKHRTARTARHRLRDAEREGAAWPECNGGNADPGHVPAAPR
jgi:hypothetical protein